MENSPKKEHQKILRNQKMGYDKYPKDKKGPYAGRFLYSEETVFKITHLWLLIKKGKKLK